MGFAEIFSERAPNNHGYVWRWRANGRSPSQCFNFYYECLDDARRNGYTVQLESARGDTAPQHGAGERMK